MSSGFVVRQEEDRLNARRLMVIFVASIVVSAAAVLVADWLLGVLAPPTPPKAPFHPAQIGTVEQTLVRDTERGLDLRRAQRGALDTWGWVDRDAGVAHVPIDVAMDVVAKADAGGTP